MNRTDAYAKTKYVGPTYKLAIYHTVKRILDIVLSIAGLIICMPLLGAIALMIKLEDPSGPILFRQVRNGRDGTRFTLFKFRTMAPDAEQWLRADPALLRKYREGNYKLEPHEDPRMTRVGLYLRKISLDELPQLLNVLLGEMSLVGPRPVVDEELLEYKDQASLFLSVKPGITGYWQVAGRSAVGYPKRVHIELRYVRERSTWLDIKILFLTVKVVFLRRGAY